MKKFILLLILLPLTMFAKWYPGSITLNNGNITKCNLQNPDANDQVIKYRLEEDGKTQKYSINEVQGYEFINSSNALFTYTTMILAHPKTFSPKEIIVDTKKTWVHLCKAGKITLYNMFYYVEAGYHQVGSGVRSGHRYFIRKEGENFARIIYDWPAQSNTFTLNKLGGLKGYLKLYFDDDCPGFSESITKEDIDSSLFTIVDKYEAGCGK